MFECMRCGYSTKYKHSLISHLKRKKPCDILLLDVERSIILEELGGKNTAKSKIVKKVTRNNPTVTRNNPVCNPILTEKRENQEKVFECQYCFRPFKYKQGKCRHEKHRCMLNPQNSRIRKLESENEILKNELINAKQIINNTTNNNTVNNIHNVNSNNTTYNTVNVNVNTIGNENIEYLKSFIRKNITDIIQCKTDFFIEYIKQKHFHPEHTENHNVVAFNDRSKSLYAYTKDDTHLERRLKSSMSLILYKNIIDDTSRYLEKLLFKEISNKRKKLKYEKASDSLDSQLDAVSDYERSENSTLNSEYDDAELKENKKRVDLHLNEIINTIYNESSRHYRSLKDYYAKRKV